MTSKQNPFSLYDFLGYFIPGALVLYCGFIAFAHINAKKFNQQMLIDAFEPFKQGGYDLYLPFIIVAYIIGHLLSFISSITIEKYTNWMNGYPSKYLLGIESKGYFYANKNKIQRWIGRSLVFFILLPVTLPDIVIGFGLNLRDIYIKAMSDASKEIIKRKIRILFNENLENKIIDDEEWFRKMSFFRFCYHYAYEHSSNHPPKMQNYVALFGFCRTLTIIFVLFFWIFLSHICFGKFCNQLIYSSLIGSSFLAYVSFIAFNKFYRRYSLEAMMALATLKIEMSGRKKSVEE